MQTVRQGSRRPITRARTPTTQDPRVALQLRVQDLKWRSLGHEPSEPPNCSIPR